MFKENSILTKVLKIGRKIIPRSLFRAAQPAYHWSLSMLGGLIYRFPSRAMKVIAITGTKGKSTTVYMTTKIFEDQNLPVAAVGSLGFKIKDREWPNTLKMTMPGRTKLQKFLYRAKNAGVKYVILEATSEGIVQNRLAGIDVDCAVFTNIHREHLESHGSFENYLKAKQKLFLKTQDIHILNMTDPNFEKFANFKAKTKITYGTEFGMLTPANLRTKSAELNLKLLGDFNLQNALAALSVAYAYNLDMDKAVESLNSITFVPGRMEIVKGQGFDVVVDYAHTPDSLEAVYKTLRPFANKLICVLGAAGGGRDKWKRPEFGKIAAKYCDEIILANEDPFDENPEEILNQIEKGIKETIETGQTVRKISYQKILDRKDAIIYAISLAKVGDTTVITGKGSEISMAVAGDKKIPWSDKKIVEDILKK